LDAPDRPVPVRISDLIWCLRSRSDGEKSKGGNSPVQVRFPANFLRRDSGQKVDVGEVLGLLGDRGGTDDVQTSEAKGMVWAALQISCRISKGRLPEWLRATATFGSHRSGRFAALDGDQKTRSGAHGYGEDTGTKGEWLKHLRSSELTFFCDGLALLRRAISPAWRRFGQKNEREVEEDGEGFL
jgi:hypothetical protein